MKFALACEGVTDQIVLVNILCGFFDDQDLDGDIAALQPPFDETDRKQADFGGWQALLRYLASSRFRDDVLNNQFIVLQIDTDISEQDGFAVKHRDAQNQELPPRLLIQNVIAKLVATIDIGEPGFYQSHANKLLFCICVHSIECWIYAHYNPKPLAKPKITGCAKALQYYLQQQGKPYQKDYRHYDALTRPFLRRQNIDDAAAKDPSFGMFVETLQTHVQVG